MSWLAVDENKTEVIFEDEPYKDEGDSEWLCDGSSNYVILPEGSIEKLIGKKLTWNDKPVEI